MRMQEIDFEARPPIDAYGGGGFRVAGERHLGSMLLLPSGRFEWSPALPAEVTLAAARPLLEAAEEIDVLLVGMGPDIAALDRGTRHALEEAGVGVEVMSTAAACRTFNVLLAEDRRVGAALIAV
jgi:uncharacterized protein